MSNARKKSIVSAAGLQIDAGGSILNKAASESTSLYQQCSALRGRLLRIKGFADYFALAAPGARQSTDPVTQLWDLFSLGIPLCYIFDQLPDGQGFAKINNSRFDNPDIPDRAKKHAIALFAIQIRSDKVSQAIPGCELFTVTDLWDRKATDGLVKVVKTVTAIVKHLPPDAFEEAPPSPPFVSAQDSVDNFAADPALSLPPANSQEAARNNIIREMVETERKYVQDLEIMQKYATALAQGNVIDQDTIHLLFPNLNKLLNFQRKFLIRFESTAEQPWQDQRWGQHFLDCEEEFIVYEPYCANYTAASELMLTYEQSLAPLNHLINVKGELPAFLIKPIQRVCKYPLLLDSLIKASTPQSYPHYEELKAGSDAAKRITDTINEAQRRAENDLTVQNLRSRVDDWKGHHLENFGDLLLDDIFIVTKSDIDREYHVFLFEKIILCCKEAVPQALNGSKKSSKNNSILKKQSAPSPVSLLGGAQSQRKNTPLLLKGRIFLGNVTQAVPVPSRASTGSGIPSTFPLAVWWKGDDDLEYFTLRCRREDQMRQWESQINRLIRESAIRRTSDRSETRGMSGMSRLANSTHPGPLRRPEPQPSTSYSHYHSPSQSSAYPQTPNGVHPRESQYRREESSSSQSYGSGPNGYPPYNGFEVEPDDDEYEDYPPTSNYGAMSGRGTPMSSRRTNGMSMPSDRDQTASPYDRPRAQTEDTNGIVMAQWRTANGQPPPPHIANSGLRPMTPRMNSNMSGMSGASFSSEASFGTDGRYPPPALKSKFSTTRLNSAYEGGDPARRGPPTPGMNGMPMNRSRSASQPQAYNPPKAAVPPLPPQGMYQRSATSMSTNKRSSGSSSHSTGESSDYSPNSSSPITPYGSSVKINGGPPVKVKVHFHEDIFVIQVPRSTEYDDLVEKVGRKIRLCGPRRDDGPLRVKYKDEDGDMVSLGSTEDVQMAFEQFRPGGQVTLYVT